MSDTLSLTCELIARASVTPEDAGCQSLLAELLSHAGFTVEKLRFGDVDNLWAWHGQGQPCLAFAGHTDVVPPGPLKQWHSDPFKPTQKDGLLYGRGAADMKGSLAAMVLAACDFVRRTPGHRGRIGVLITSDEEGIAVDGTTRVVELLRERQETITWCLIGEPSSDRKDGDRIRNGRRGSLNGIATVRGIQGHVAYPEDVRNPIHELAPALAELSTKHWDEGNAYYPPTSFQVSNINAGTGATNVVPGRVEVVFNFRYCTEQTDSTLRAAVEKIFSEHNLDYDIEWQHSGAPFLTEAGEFSEAVQDATEEHLGVRPELSTGGGTSDGRFIATLGTEVIELGPVNATIHKLNECVRIDSLDAFRACYTDIATRLLK